MSLSKFDDDKDTVFVVVVAVVVSEEEVNDNDVMKRCHSFILSSINVNRSLYGSIGGINIEIEDNIRLHVLNVTVACDMT